MIPFLANLPQLKILNVIFSGLIRVRLVLLSHRAIFKSMQKPVINDI